MTAETHDSARAQDSDRAHVRRIIRIAVGVLVIEGALALVAYLAPALRVLMRPVYVIAAALGALSAWRAAAGRTRGDRRHAERRHPS